MQEIFDIQEFFGVAPLTFQHIDSVSSRVNTYSKFEIIRLRENLSIFVFIFLQKASHSCTPSNAQTPRSMVYSQVSRDPCGHPVYNLWLHNRSGIFCLFSTHSVYQDSVPEHGV